MLRSLFLLRWSLLGWRLRRRSLCCGSALEILHGRVRMLFIGKDTQRDGRYHKQNGTPGGDLGKQRCRAPRAKGRLAARAAEGGGNISAFAVLQETHNNQDGAHDYVNYGDKNIQH